MAVKTRYQTINNLLQAGIQLACTPAMHNYLNVLKEAQHNNASLNGGTSYNESDKPTRKISYVYALNSIYRDLLQWQRQYPEDETIPQMRQQICNMFPYFMENEFSIREDANTLNYQINDDCIQINTRNSETQEIIDPQSFTLDDEHSQILEDFLHKIDLFIDSKYYPDADNLQEHPFKDKAPSKEPDNYPKLSKNRVHIENATDEAKFEQTSEPIKKNDLSKNLLTSINFIRKMQFFIARKTQGKEVHDFRTTEEKSRTFRNGFIHNIENVLQTNKDPDASLYNSTQDFCNFLDSNGMQMVWYKEPPYESEFVNHLDEMKQDLIGDTPAEFYNTKLPVFLDLCNNLNEYSPEESAVLQNKINDFMSKPDKKKLIDTITEAQRLSQELRNIDETKSKAMRAAWNGMIINPPKNQLSPFLQEIILIRERLGSQNISEEMRKKISDYTAKNYKIEDYDFEKCKAWNICKQVPQFKQFENNLFSKICALGISPQEMETLTYADIAYLINNTMTSVNKSLRDNQGAAIASDKTAYLKELVQNNEKELRKSLQNYYQQKFTMQMINDGVAQKKSDVKIQKKVAADAAIAAEKVIKDMKEGRANDDFNVHHNFSLSNIAYFEKVTGKPFTEINKYVVLINKEFHSLIHMNENNVDKYGRIKMDNNVTHRTKYVLQQRLLTENNNITGYIGRAFSFAIMLKPCIKAIIDFRSFIFDKETIQENINLQQQLIEFRQGKKNKFGKLTLPHLNLKELRKYLRELLQPAEEINLQTPAPLQTELQKAREMDKMNQKRRISDLQVVDKTPKMTKVPTQSKLGAQIAAWHQQKKKAFHK